MQVNSSSFTTANGWTFSFFLTLALIAIMECLVYYANNSSMMVQLIDYNVEQCPFNDFDFN